MVYAAPCGREEEHDAAYELLAYALRAEFGLDELPSIDHEAGGRPYFPERSDVHFNLSHSRGAVVCALHDAPVGVDVELIRKAPKRLASGMDDRSFFLEWTRKEATVKCSGLGIGALLSPVVPSERCRSFEDTLPGWIITVCPSKEGDVIIKTVKAAML